MRAERRVRRDRRRRRRGRGVDRRARPAATSTRADGPLRADRRCRRRRHHRAHHRRGRRRRSLTLLPAEGFADEPTSRPFLAGQRARCRGPSTSSLRVARRRRSPQLYTRMSDRRAASTCPATGASCWRRCTARTSTRRSSSCLTRRRLRFMGKDTLWKRQSVGVAAVGARWLPGHPGHGRPRGAAALHRRAGGRRAAGAVPRGRAQVRPARAAAVRRCGVRRASRPACRSCRSASAGRSG